LNGGFGASLHYDYTVSPTLILDFNTGGNYSPAKFGSTVSGPASSTAGWGFQPSVTDIMGNTLLGIGQVRGTDAEVTGNTLGSGNLNGPTANALYTTNFSYSASLTKILGRHTLKFGYDGRRYYDNFSQAAGSSPYGDGFFITGAGSFLNVADDGNIWGNSLDDANNMGRSCGDWTPGAMLRQPRREPWLRITTQHTCKMISRSARNSPSTWVFVGKCKRR